MYTNYLKTAWRSLIRGKIYSIINVLGLSTGLAVAIILSLWIKDEVTFDGFHNDADRIYRAWVKEHYQGDIFFNTVTPFQLGVQLSENLPEVESMTRYVTLNTSIKKDDIIEAEQLFLVEPMFLEMFDFPLVQGSVSHVLDDLRKMVLTEQSAEKYFGSEDPIGKTLFIELENEWVGFQIAGIAQTPPTNTGFQFDFLIPFENTENLYSPQTRQSWTNVAVETFIKIRNGSDLTDFNQKVASFMDQQVKDIYAAGEYQVGFQPLTEIHLDNSFPVGILPVSDGRYPTILAGIALLILVLAGINFTTLSVGRSLNRAREVGIRKTAGASRTQLMIQFWSEAILTTAIAMIFGMLLSWLLLPAFNQLAGSNLILSINANSVTVIILSIIIIGLASGIYPALLLARMNPINSLRGSILSESMPKHQLLRALIGFQFTLSMCLVCCTLVMQKQLHFMQNKNLGYSHDQIVTIPITKAGSRLSEVITEGNNIAQLLEDNLSSDPNIGDISISCHIFGTSGWTNVGYSDPTTQKFQSFNVNQIDHSFIPLYGINLKQGRNLMDNNPADQKSVIINEAYSEAFKINVNETLQAPFESFRVIAVSDDFNYQSLHQQVAPLVLTTDLIAIIRTGSDVSFNDPNPKLSIKVRGSKITDGLATIERAWKEVTEIPYTFTFVDDIIARQYQAEKKLSQILSLATMFAIFIASLGLFGIVTLLVNQKAKEIGIRKLLGANTLNIIYHFNRKFILLILLAGILSIPIAWYFMSNWLADFEYHTSLHWSIFFISLCLIVLIAVSTISLQSFRAAIGNPINSIRSE
ncbi:MAG: FtsX-like permease family protein [Saprospiraceae bacterium]|nr:FtsX-like permease family protein [Saprospiraceae bacterium]